MDARKFGLRAISVDSTGVEWAAPQSAQRHNITLMNVPAFSTDSVAEHVLAEILLHSRRIHLSYLDQIRGAEPSIRRAWNLRGRILGVMGLGSIGKRVAEIAIGLDMSVIAWNRTPKQVPGIQMVSAIDVFSQSHVIVLCLKAVLGAEGTTNLVNSFLLQHCRPDAIIVNPSAESIIDSDALLNALETGRLGGYSTTRNKLKSPALLDLENVTKLPANAWFSEESFLNLNRTWIQNVVDYLDGNPTNIVTC